MKRSLSDSESLTPCYTSEEFDDRFDKKRRLSVEQLQALEKIFEVENKLEPEKKLKLAKELQLQPRQVSVWFQNRRARSKTKHLELDYATLKASYDALRMDCENLQKHNQSLQLQIKELKAKLAKDDTDDKVLVVEQIPSTESNHSSDVFDDVNVLIDENSLVMNYKMISSHCVVDDNTMELQHDTISFVSSNELNEIQVYDQHYHHYQLPMLKVEESDEFVSSFFDEEQAPILNWCYSYK